MQIYCDYCGSQIDIDKNRSCPCCGAPFANDPELKALRERDKELSDLNAEKTRLEIERLDIENKKAMQNTPNKTSMNPGCFWGLVALSILGLFFILLIVCVMLDSDTTDVGREKDVGITTARQSISITISMEPIEIPDIPQFDFKSINDDIVSE